MRIINDKALLLKVRNPERITTVIPKSKQIKEKEVLVNWGVHETKVLRNLNIKAPSPILGQYKWSGQHKPFEHQKTTAAFFTLNKRAYCFNEMGTGKTASAIWAADYLLTKKIINRVLVICPLSIMDSAWKADLFKFAMHRSVSIAHGPAKKRSDIIQQGSDFVIINYDGIEVVLDTLMGGGFDLIIVDEATHYKNPRTNRWKALNSLVAPNTWLWMMTGTPAAQSPLDAYGLAKMMNPSSVPKFFGSFRDMVMQRISQFKWLPKDTAVDTVHNILQPAIRYTKEECLDLPELVYTKRAIQLSRQQIRYYEQLRTKMVMVAAGEEVTAANAAINLNKLLQISSGAVYTDDGETLEFDIANRYNVLREVMDETSQKTLVFVPFKNTMALLTDKLNKDGISADYINGEVPAHKRTDIFKRFQTEKDPQVLIIQPQAAAHGVTLTAADTVVWWGPVSSLEIYAQANARVHRSGQSHKCTVVQLVGSPAERHVYRLLDNRIDVHSKIIELYKEILD